MDLEAIKRKLRALSQVTVDRGATEGEAMAALAAMSDMLEANGLTSADIEAGASDEARPSIHEQQIGRRTGVHRTFHALKKYCGVELWYKKRVDGLTSDRRRYKYQTSICVFGFPQDVAAFHAMADLITVAMVVEWFAYRAKHPTSQGDRPAFEAGMASRISQRLDEMRREREQQQKQTAASGGGTALVVVKDAAVEKAFRALNLQLRSGPGMSAGNGGDARAAGRAAGDRVNLSRAKGVTETRKLT